MPSNRFTDAEKAQWELKTAEGHVFTAFQRKLRTKYRESAASRSSTRQWYQDIQSSGGIHDMGEIGVHRSKMKWKKW